jgi:xanthine dehydrogenase accessory factor
MLEILTALDEWQQAREEIALATLVRVERSAPRQPGARLAMTRSGKMAGSVSAGCVENDVFERATQVLDRGAPVLATYGISDDDAFRVGLSCGGSIDVLIEPFVACGVWRAVREAIEHQRPVALATALAPAALAGRKLARMNNEATVGSIEGEIDAVVIEAARQLLRDGGTRTLTVPRPGADATVFVEAFAPPPHLVIVGATHTAMTLCHMAKPLGFRITVIDARGLYATRERFPDADDLILGWPADVLSTIPFDASAFVVTLAHDPKFDLPTLARALRADTRYVGALGSRATHAKRVAQLRAEGFTDADLARIHAPIGLDLGARTPEEIALSILAEIVATRHGRGANSTRESMPSPPGRGRG